jgi:ABC-type uncharacterized transport system ATPase subunit
VNRTRPRGSASTSGMTTHPHLEIEADGLLKRFGPTTAVDGIDLTVQAGTVYGVLGPNGAGKTTTIRMLAIRLSPDAGSARVLGHDVVTDAAAALCALARSLWRVLDAPSPPAALRRGV